MRTVWIINHVKKEMNVFFWGKFNLLYLLNQLSNILYLTTTGINFSWDLGFYIFFRSELLTTFLVKYLTQVVVLYCTINFIFSYFMEPVLKLFKKKMEYPTVLILRRVCSPVAIYPKRFDFQSSTFLMK